MRWQILFIDLINTRLANCLIRLAKTKIDVCRYGYVQEELSVVDGQHSVDVEGLLKADVHGLLIAHVREGQEPVGDQIGFVPFGVKLDGQMNGENTYGEREIHVPELSLVLPADASQSERRLVENDHEGVNVGCRLTLICLMYSLMSSSSSFSNWMNNVHSCRL